MSEEKFELLQIVKEGKVTDYKFIKGDIVDLVNAYGRTSTELLTAKEENEKFRKDNEEKNEFLEKLGVNASGEFKRIKYYINTLTQQNKQMMEEISEIRNMINPDRSWESFDEWEQYLYKAVSKIDKLLQQFKGVE